MCIACVIKGKVALSTVHVWTNACSIDDRFTGRDFVMVVCRGFGACLARVNGTEGFVDDVTMEGIFNIGLLVGSAKYRLVIGLILGE